MEVLERRVEDLEEGYEELEHYVRGNDKTGAPGIVRQLEHFNTELSETKTMASQLVRDNELRQAREEARAKIINYTLFGVIFQGIGILVILWQAFGG